jgi:hypothetical protein
MRRNFLACLLIFLSGSLFAQGVAELEKRKGFKQEEFDAKLYSVENDSYSKIGEVDVDKVEIKTYKNLIYQIHVVADKDTRLMKALESIYGKAEYDIKRETYFWKGQTVILKFRSESKNKLEMIYTSYTMLDMMRADKNKKVQDIAEDF